MRRGLRVDGVYAFGPPNPGNLRVTQDYAYALARGMLGISLKNQRDLVTDVPVDLKNFGEEYVQPWPLLEINQPGAPLDPWLLLRDHHIELYQAGVYKLPAVDAAVGLNEAVDAVARLYQTADGWDWLSPVDGAWWAIRVFPNGAKLAIARGSTTGKDWLDDFDAVQVPVLGARVSAGFWSGVAAASDALDAQLA